MKQHVKVYCRSCRGTGLYRGFGEKEGAAVYAQPAKELVAMKYHILSLKRGVRKSELNVSLEPVVTDPHQSIILILRPALPTSSQRLAAHIKSSLKACSRDLSVINTALTSGKINTYRQRM